MALRPGFALSTLSGLALALPLLACAASSRENFENPTDAPATDPGPAPAPTGDFDTKPVPTPPPPEVNEVFGHSASRLYRLDPKTKAVTEVGMFDGCADIVDIALDEASSLFAVSDNALYTVDKTTAKCTFIATGAYPNSLSFVPKGTLDATAEALVGYEDANYVRIDPKDGSKSVIGTLGGGLKSSGDIVSVKGGATYLTVKGTSQCSTNDCLVEVDPKTGKVLKNWGSVEHKNVFGLSFWGGKIYGFDSVGQLFEVTFGTKQLATTVIPMPGRPTDLSFWGAGSSTSAPLVSTPQ